MIRFNDPHSDLIEDLLANSPAQDRCPHLKTDNVSLYCSNQLTGEVIEKRRGVCDSYSLQLWCLDKERFCKCLFYNNAQELD